MAVFDFFDAPELARPEVTVADAQALASRMFGITGTAVELGSNQDRNFRIDSAGGRYLLKVDNGVFSAAEVTAQNRAMVRLSQRGLSAPIPLAGVDGNTVQEWSISDRVHTVRLLTFVEGEPLANETTFTPDTVAALGRLAATVTIELADFTADGLDRSLQWDLRNATRVIDHLIDGVTDAARREQLARAAAAAAERLSEVSGALRVQAIHGDITDDNVLGEHRGGVFTPTAVIDFGDLAEGWLVAELAVAVTSLLHHGTGVIDDILPAVEAFDRVIPLTDPELRALWPLAVLRSAALVVSGEHQLTIDEGNDYAADRTGHEWRQFEAATAIGQEEATEAIRAAVGRPRSGETASPSPMSTPLFPGSDMELLDFSVTSPALNTGRWMYAETEWQLAREALARASVAAAPYGQYRLTRSEVNSVTETATLALCWELFVASAATVCSPQGADVLAVTDDAVHLAAGETELRISGLAPSVSVGDHVEVGQAVGLAINQGYGLARVRVQRVAPGQANVPAFVRPADAERWMSVVADPAAAIGVQAVPNPFDAELELERRSRIFASAQERYYLRPPQIERGWKEFLIGSDGRVYLDMVNNVAAIGHSHPRQVTAISDQLALLNTNSRFLYRALADLSERLVDLAPDPSLDTVLLVNSGTEAVDLALRLAQVFTGRWPIVALREAYHGWSMGADAVTTSAYDNPLALANRPDWVEVADVPNTYRGRHKNAEGYLAELRTQLDAMADAGRHPAAFICEPVLGNAGGVLLPDGYLVAAYEEIRQRGGLCIADEVQVGYGRLGHHFWGVEQQGAVPDIITIAKAMGNGYPLGAVITRKEIAESLSREGNFFSSAGGSPVSCAAGLAVLDVIRDEGLQANAAKVGDHLVSRLRELAERHPVIGAIHGMGLYLGIELVRDRETREPAVEVTAAVCERLLDLGVIMQATSERQNVLKIKPPLCLSPASADFFVEALDQALTRG